jgi:hypothetical protein
MDRAAMKLKLLIVTGVAAYLFLSLVFFRLLGFNRRGNSETKRPLK